MFSDGFLWPHPFLHNSLPTSEITALFEWSENGKVEGWRAGRRVFQLLSVGKYNAFHN